MNIKQIWFNINRVLTILNLFLIGILTFGNIPKKYQDAKIPFLANITLLVLLIFMVGFYFY